MLTFSSVCFGQNEIKAVLDSVIQKARQTSMYTSTVNWDSLQKAIYVKAENAKSIQELKPAFTTLINGMLDKHGMVRDAKNYSVIAYFTDFSKLNQPNNRTRDREISKIVYDTSVQFEYKLLKGKIGYLKLVAIGPSVDVEKESKRIRSAVIELSKSKINGWIMDLRYNGGGNMNPMVSGIAPIIGDGKVGSLKSLTGEKLFDWDIKSSNFIYAGYQAVTLPNEPIFKKHSKVAVLTSRWTISSGDCSYLF